jgi:hypothetical protein
MLGLTILAVVGAIHFDHDAPLKADEVEEVATERGLPADVEAAGSSGVIRG